MYWVSRKREYRHQDIKTDLMTDLTINCDTGTYETLKI